MRRHERASNAVTVTLPGSCSGAPLTPASFLAYRVGNTGPRRVGSAGERSGADKLCIECHRGVCRQFHDDGFVVEWDCRPGVLWIECARGERLRLECANVGADHHAAVTRRARD